jgi:hypothetical protein
MNQTNIENFRVILSYHYTDLVIIIEHFNEMCDLASMPTEVLYTLQDEATELSRVMMKYSECLRSEKEEEFLERMDDILPLVDEEMASAYNYLGELNYCLMEYGEGPPISRHNILCTQPMEV